MRNLFSNKNIFIFFAVFLGIQSYCQDSIDREQKWKFKAEPKLMFPSIKGKAGVWILPVVNVDQSSSDFFSNLKFAGMLAVEASKDDWVILGDVLYASLGTQVQKEPFVTSGELSTQQLSIGVGLLRKLTPWLEVGLMANVNNIEAGFDVNLINPQNGQPLHLQRSISKTWFDPMLVARAKNLPNQKFLYSVSGEIGGFNVGSKLAWQLQGLMGYQISDLFYVLGGYHINDINYEGKSGNTYLHYDMNTQGPVIKLGLNLNK